MAGIVTSKYLRKCRLWQGSQEQVDWQFGGIEEERLRARRDKLAAAPDRTEEEDAYLAAMEQTLVDPAGNQL